MGSKKKYLIFTSESLEKVSHFLGINLDSNYISRLYGLAIVLLLIFLSQISWQIMCIKHCEERFIIKFIVRLYYSLIILLVLSTVSTSLFRPKQFVFPHQEIFAMDSILESYGTRFTYKDIFLAKYLQDIITAIIILLDMMINVYNVILDNTIQMICLCLFNWYCRMCILVINGLFCHHINDIYLRFRELNKITTRYSRESLSISCIDLTVNSKFDKCDNAVIIKIRSIQYIHHGLYILAKKINSNFGLQLLIMSLVSLTAIINLLHGLYYSIKTSNNSIRVTITYMYKIFFHIFRFLYVSYICQRSKNEFKQMAIILHDVFLEYKSLRAEVVHFSLQLVHENLTFTALELYEIDIPLICSIAGAVITYFVMVIQLDTKFVNYNVTTTI